MLWEKSKCLRMVDLTNWFSTLPGVMGHFTTSSQKAERFLKLPNLVSEGDYLYSPGPNLISPLLPFYLQGPARLSLEEGVLTRKLPNFACLFRLFLDIFVMLQKQVLRLIIFSILFQRVCVCVCLFELPPLVFKIIFYGDEYTVCKRVKGTWELSAELWTLAGRTTAA